EALEACPSFACLGDGSVPIACLVQAVAGALSGCEPPAPSGPQVEGPIPGAPFVAGTAFELSEVGYTQLEFFVTGTASAYVNDGPLPVDGRYSVRPDAEAAFKTRMLVHR